MASETRMATDLVEEFVLRRWAREHYVPAESRDSAWHPVVLEEMNHKDRELSEAAEYALSGRRIVPLVPESDWILHGPHAEPAQGTVLLRIPDVVTEMM
jgi:hypothetical protein